MIGYLAGDCQALGYQILQFASTAGTSAIVPVYCSLGQVGMYIFQKRYGRALSALP